MEAVGLTTSILALAKTAKELYILLKDIRDAPSTVLETTYDLNLLQGVLESIRQDQMDATIQSDPVRKVLDDCTTKLKRLHGFLEGLNVKSTSKRHQSWGALMFRLKKDKAAEYSDSLNSAKMSLSLAMQLVCWYELL